MDTIKILSPFSAASRPSAARGFDASFALGLLAVASFSLTLPLTRLAVPHFDPAFLAVSRMSMAGVLALVLLLATGAPRPSRRQLEDLAIVAGGVVVGFPLAASYAMRSVPASHGGVVVGLVPLATALLGSRIARERPSRRFWIASGIGSVSVVAFALRDGTELATGDALLVIAMLSAALGYAFGGRLSRELGGSRTISWALVLCLPFTLPATYVLAPSHAPNAPFPVIVGLVYLAVVNQLLAFFAWNHALASGGIARVSQAQLAQPFFTLLASAALLGEPIAASSAAVATVVVACVAIGRSSPSRSVGDP